MNNFKSGTFTWQFFDWQGTPYEGSIGSWHLWTSSFKSGSYVGGDPMLSTFRYDYFSNISCTFRAEKRLPVMGF